MIKELNNFPVVESDKTGWPWVEDDANKVSYDPQIAWPKISIVTPSFNQGRYIEETIRSILMQNYPNLEYIIIDGGSTDDTVTIIKKYEPWINFWISEPDNGQSQAINKGLAKCTGQIFNWLNSDDTYTKGALKEVALAFIKQPSLIAVSGYENHFGEAMESYVYPGTQLKKTLAQTIEFCEISQPSTFLKLSVVKKVDGVSEDLHCIMDGEMWIKILMYYGQKNFAKLNQVVVNFRFHKNSKTVENFTDNSFLLERSSIIASLQRSVHLPVGMITYFTKHVYGLANINPLNRNWKFNDAIISPRKLRLYFIKKYIVKQFISKDATAAYSGIKQLIQNKAFDFFLVKACIKLLLKT